MAKFDSTRRPTNYQYEDVQVSTVKSDADGLSTEIDNAAELSREGFELEAAWLITDRIQISGNYAYIGGSYDSFPPYLGLTITPTDGLAPENSFYAALDWDLIRRGKHNVNFQLSGNYQDETISIGASQSLYTAQGAPQIPVNFQQPSNQSRTTGQHAAHLLLFGGQWDELLGLGVGQEHYRRGTIGPLAII